VELDDARHFLEEHHHAVMHTYRADGTPQLSPVAVTVDDVGAALVSTRATAVKVTNLQRDPRTSLCVFTDAFYGPWLRIDGTAEVQRLPGAMEGLIDYYRRVAGEHPDWDEYREAMEAERRVLLRIELSHVGPDVAG
jgi:PPOX class probable F420-dependent enzyme